MRKLLLVLLFFVACSTNQDAGNSAFANGKPEIPEPILPFNPEKYVCYKTDKPLTIDGKADETAWKNAEWTIDFRDIEGESKPIPRFRTRAKMLWDEKFFYVFAEMEEPDVWAKLKKRDSVIFYDNDFEVFIDPDGDTHRYYELEINAFSTEWDLFLDKPYRDKNCALFFWDLIGMKSAVDVQGTLNKPGDKDTGWTLEIAIPWEPLKECANKEAPPQNGDQWRVGFSRVEWKTEVKNGKYEKVINPKTNRPFPEDNWVWSPQGVVNMHYPEMWGFVQFSDKVAGSGTDEFVYQKEEDIKWALRQVYYRQRAFKEKNGSFTNDINKLGLADAGPEGYNWPPQIQNTDNLFEANVTSKDGKEQWRIVQDGRVWQPKND